MELRKRSTFKNIYNLWKNVKKSFEKSQPKSYKDVQLHASNNTKEIEFSIHEKA